MPAGAGLSAVLPRETPPIGGLSGVQIVPLSLAFRDGGPKNMYLAASTAQPDLLRI